VKSVCKPDCIELTIDKKEFAAVVIMPEMNLDKANKRPFEEDEPAMQGNSGRKKITHRGTRSRKAQNKRRQKYVDSGGPERARNTINNLTGTNKFVH
jgi:hypothetical protein